MIILPAEHPLDFKRPPVITLLLIVLNCLIYFGYQGGDSAREERAVKTYLDAGLLSREKDRFITAFSTEQQLTGEQQKSLGGLRNKDLAGMLLTDLQFEHQLHQDPAYLADSQWRAARQPAEAARDQLSHYRFGFVPAKFTVQGLFGAMFLHGSVDHLLGNMLFLFIFGFALEIALGRWMFLGLYLVSGLASHLFWWLFEPSWLTGIGASGAVSGLMGMYLGVYGLRKINFFYWLGPLFGYFRAPALWILPLWMGKELLGMLANDHVNRYAHLGGLAAGFLLVWLPKRFGQLKVDESFLLKVDPDAQYKREVAALAELISRFALDQAAPRGLDLLNRYPGRLALLEQLYPVAKSRQDKALLGALLKQVFALPAASGQLGLLHKLALDMGDPQQRLLEHPAIQLHLLQQLLKAGDERHALYPWRKLACRAQPPAAMLGLSLQLGKLLGQRQDRHSLTEVSAWMRQHFPDAEQTQLLGIYQQQRASS
ncbi:MAG: rhomboid family intramembrane serine protease [Pseudomonas sp.]|uniref:rhomboid family intramembrane serine protease n=1 Tax=Pseudomonas sp. TaxID=306 RepID=UPI003BB58A9A